MCTNKEEQQQLAGEEQEQQLAATLTKANEKQQQQQQLPTPPPPKANAAETVCEAMAAPTSQVVTASAAAAAAVGNKTCCTTCCDACCDADKQHADNDEATVKTNVEKEAASKTKGAITGSPSHVAATCAEGQAATSLLPATNVDKQQQHNNNSKLNNDSGGDSTIIGATLELEFSCKSEHTDGATQQQQQLANRYANNVSVRYYLKDCRFSYTYRQTHKHTRVLYTTVVGFDFWAA